MDGKGRTIIKKYDFRKRYGLGEGVEMSEIIDQVFY